MAVHIVHIRLVTDNIYYTAIFLLLLKPTLYYYLPNIVYFSNTACCYQAGNGTV